MRSNAMRSVVCLLVLAGMLSASGFAANKNRTGTAGAQELLLPVGARGIAIGASSMVTVSGVEAIYWNPAGLGRLDRSVEAMVSSMNYIADINVIYGALAVQAGDFGTLGFTLKSVNFGNIPVTNEAFPDGTGEQYSPTFITLGATYAKAITDRIAVGITGSLVSERILSMTASGIAVNVGIQYRDLGLPGLDLGVAVKNIGPNMKFQGSNLTKTGTSSDATARGTQFFNVDAASAEMPSNLEIGLGYRRQLDEKNGAMVSALFRNNNYLEDEYALGAEYSFENLFFLRGGYTFSPQTQKDLTNSRAYIFDYTLGAGLHYDVSGLDLAFDYAYRHQKFFDGSNVITLRVGF